MHPVETMQVFARVAELGSFTRAADSLGQPKASVSMAIQQLEERLGARLLNRTTRKVELTQDGRAFYERCKDLLADFDEVQNLFAQSSQTLRGRLRVDMTSGMARDIVIPRLPEFLREHPQIELEISCADRKVDLVREGFDCVVRVGGIDDDSLIARRLGQFRIVNCASPSYLNNYGTPLRLDDLASHRLIHYVGSFGSRPDGWEHREGDRWQSYPMAGAITVNSIAAYEACCLAGLGLIQAPLSGVRHHLAGGRLVEVLPDFPAEPMPVSLVYVHRRNLSKRLQAFMAWIAMVLAPYLDTPDQTV
jgi:DNA-binding transcriptional LysR family regulator